jgi:hypothetical protein
MHAQHAPSTSLQAGHTSVHVRCRAPARREHMVQYTIAARSPKTLAQHAAMPRTATHMRVAHRSRVGCAMRMVRAAYGRWVHTPHRIDTRRACAAVITQTHTPPLSVQQESAPPDGESAPPHTRTRTHARTHARAHTHTHTHTHHTAHTQGKGLRPPPRAPAGATVWRSGAMLPAALNTRHG